MTNTEQALQEFRHGDRNQAFSWLQRQFQPLIEKQVSLFAGTDEESANDCRQEALIGLFKATSSYQEESGVPFAAYASICIRHRLISFQRHARLLTMLRPFADDEEEALPDDGQASPEHQALQQEEERLLWQRLSEVLTAFECDCLRCHLDGYSYSETAAHLQTEGKAVDNALQRVRRKLRRQLQTTPDFFRF